MLHASDGELRTAPRRFGFVWTLVLLALFSSACSPHPGRLLVVVRTDFDVPAEMGEILVRVARTDGTSMQEVPFRLRAADAPDMDDGTRTMPLSFAVHPREPDTEVEIVLTGMELPARTPIVERRAIVGFVPGSTRQLDLFLSETCSLEVVRCTPDETCVDGRCIPVPRLDPSTLPIVMNPGGELDGSTPDASDRSDGGMDAGMDGGREMDAGMDAGGGDVACMLAPPSPLSPENGDTLATLRPTFVWTQACAGATYELDVDGSCTTPGFDACAFPSPEVRAMGLTATRYEPSSDLPVATTAPIGRRYYWRVRACLGATCSDWSPVRYVDVGRLASDLNGDGYPEVLVDARDQDTLAGAVFVHTGSASGLGPGVALNAGSLAGDRFGFSLAYAGDLDGDGYGDVVIGARQKTDPERNEGGAYVFLGGPSGLTTAALLVDNPDDDSNGQFGFSVASAGDVNGDGYPDVIVGAAYQDGAARDSGRAFVYFGGVPGTGIAATPNVVLDEPTAEDSALFGYSVRPAGDVNGDGYGDVVVGDARHDVPGARDSGVAYVFYGGPGGTETTFSAMLVPNAPQANALFGSSAAGVDLNGDGYSDVVVGASYWDSATPDSGGAFVYYSGPSGLPSTPDLVLDNPMGAGAAWFGDSMAAVGDLNADGFADLGVGALFANTPENDEGNAHVFFGSAAGIATMPDMTLDNPTDESTGSFGVALGSAGDVNADGIDDLIVGAYQQPISGNTEGAAYVFYGADGFAPTTPDQSLQNPTHQSGGRYGYAVTGLQ